MRLLLFGPQELFVNVNEVKIRSKVRAFILKVWFYAKLTRLEKLTLIHEFIYGFYDILNFERITSLHDHILIHSRFKLLSLPKVINSNKDYLAQRNQSNENIYVK